MFASAQISLYPLRQQHLSPTIDNAVKILTRYGLEVLPGSMSTLVSGDDKTIFSAIQELFQNSSEEGDVVMAVTLSNTCPVN